MPRSITEAHSLAASTSRSLTGRSAGVADERLGIVADHPGLIRCLGRLGNGDLDERAECSGGVVSAADDRAVVT